MRPLAFASTLAPRTPLLIADLTELGAAPPPMEAFDAGDDAARWGVLYVVEGSRLGGAMLARMVGEGLPRRYLGAVHPAGQWRAIRAAVDAAGRDADAEWRERMVAAALSCFDLYAAAARLP